MEIKVFHPKSKLLQEHIDCFYLIERKAEDPPTTYLTFPSTNQLLSLYANTSTEVGPNSVILRSCPGSPLESRIVGKFQKLVFVRYEGAIHEITSLFRPLSINAFLPKPLKTFVKGHFSLFNPYPSFSSSMEDIYQITDPTEKLAAIENFWMNQYNHFQHPFLESAISYLSDETLEGSGVNELCELHQISRQTLHQHFAKYIGKSPSTYRRIIRFRKALRNYHVSASAVELSQVSALSNYFDQSHMIKDFRAITGYTPKVFFKNISQMGNGLINFMFLKNL